MGQTRWLLRDFDKAQPHPLTTEEIDRLVRRGSAGRYVLGYRDGRGAFRIQHVGFAARDLNAELSAWVGKARCFKFRVELPGPSMTIGSAGARMRGVPRHH